MDSFEGCVRSRSAHDLAWEFSALFASALYAARVRHGTFFALGASYFLWRKESNQRKHFKSNSKLLSEAKPGFFDETSMSHRKTMHILCIALRVSEQGIMCQVCKIIGTLPSIGIQTEVLSLAWPFMGHSRNMS